MSCRRRYIKSPTWLKSSFPSSDLLISKEIPTLSTGVISGKIDATSQDVPIRAADEILQDPDEFFPLLEDPNTIETALTNLTKLSSKQTLHLQQPQIQKLIEIIDPSFEVFTNVKRSVLILLDDLLGSHDKEAIELILNPGNLEIYVQAFASFFKDTYDPTGSIKCAHFIDHLIKIKPQNATYFVDFGLLHIITNVMKSGQGFEECITCISHFPSFSEYSDFVSFILPFLIQFASNSENGDLQSVSLNTLQSLCQENPSFEKQLISQPQFLSLFENIEDDLTTDDLLDFLMTIGKAEVLTIPIIHDFIFRAIQETSCFLEAINFLYKICFDENFVEIFDQEMYLLLIGKLEQVRFDYQEKIITIICVAFCQLNPSYIEHQQVLEWIIDFIDTAKGTLLEVLLRTLITIISASTIQGIQDQILESEVIRSSLENIEANPELIDNNEEILNAIEEILSA